MSNNTFFSYENVNVGKPMGSIILYSGRCVNPVFILVWAKYCISKFKFHLSRLWVSLVAQRVKIMRSYFVEGCEHKWKKCKSVQNILSQKSGRRCLSGLDWERILLREGTQSGLSCCWVAQSCLTLCDPEDCSTPGSSILHSLLELLQLTSNESVMPSNYLIHASPFAFNLSQHQSLF